MQPWILVESYLAEIQCCRTESGSFTAKTKNPEACHPKGEMLLIVSLVKVSVSVLYFNVDEIVLGCSESCKCAMNSAIVCGYASNGRGVIEGS